MAVVARDNADVADLARFLTVQGIPAATVGGTTDEHASGDKARVMTVHRAEGLEYRAVAIPRTGSTKLPPRWVKQLDDEGRDSVMAWERGLPHVSNSRARERLYVSWTGQPSC